MKKAFVVTVMLVLSSFPTFSQTAFGGDERDSSSARKDRDLDDILRGAGEYGREGMRRGRGASFLLRNGDATLAVRCDPQDTMKACVEAALTLVDRARSLQSGAAPGGTPPGAPGAQPPSR